MRSHRRVARSPDWTAAAVSGFVAGAVLMVLEMLWSTNLMGATPWTMSHMIAAIVTGPDALQSHAFSVSIVALSLVIHYVLGIVFGMILAAIIAPFHLDSSPAMVLLVGAAYGLVLYLVNFYGMARIFTWFADVRGWPALIAHLIFGMVAAGMYWKLERPALMR
ncbi:hypothetical protein [Noviherbaspirillum massiliense]|uniref:hypothetical protein n=1 Tax=Noviherbaspirillum massiliense TaxID=1465823 RepID=UPI0002EE2D5D